MTPYTRAPVVVGADGSAAAVCAVRWAAARAARDGAPLRIVHACEPPAHEKPVLEALRTRGSQWLSEARAAVAGVTSAVRVETALLTGRTVPALLRESAGAAVVALGNRGRNALTGLLAGSTAQAVVGRAACPVVLVRGRTEEAEGPVVVGVDGTESSAAAVGFAFAEAAAARAPLVALHAWSESVFELALAGDRAPIDLARYRETAAEALAERLAAWQEKYPEVLVEPELVHDRPGPALRGHTGTARLVVVGRRGRGGFPGLLIGSTSHHLVHHAACPVAVVRAGG